MILKGLLVLLLSLKFFFSSLKSNCSLVKLSLLFVELLVDGGLVLLDLLFLGAELLSLLESLNLSLNDGSLLGFLFNLLFFGRDDNLGNDNLLSKLLLLNFSLFKRLTGIGKLSSGRLFFLDS